MIEGLTDLGELEVGLVLGERRRRRVRRAEREACPSLVGARVIADDGPTDLVDRQPRRQ